MLLSDTVRLHRALRVAGVPADLHVTEAAGHGGFFGMAPEDEEIMREIRRFVDRHWETKQAGYAAGRLTTPQSSQAGSSATRGWPGCRAQR